jgi:hypothetical protein
VGGRAGAKSAAGGIDRQDRTPGLAGLAPPGEEEALLGSMASTVPMAGSAGPTK